MHISRAWPCGIISTKLGKARIAAQTPEARTPGARGFTGYLPSFWVKLRVLAVPALNSTAVHNWPVRSHPHLRSCHRVCTALPVQTLVCNVEGLGYVLHAHQLRVLQRSSHL